MLMMMMISITSGIGALIAPSAFEPSYPGCG
jgi:hypothetical protein